MNNDFIQNIGLKIIFAVLSQLPEAVYFGGLLLFMHLHSYQQLISYFIICINVANEDWLIFGLFHTFKFITQSFIEIIIISTTDCERCTL